MSTYLVWLFVIFEIEIYDHLPIFVNNIPSRAIIFVCATVVDQIVGELTWITTLRIIMILKSLIAILHSQWSLSSISYSTQIAASPWCLMSAILIYAFSNYII